LSGRFGLNNLSRQGKQWRDAQPYSTDNHLPEGTAGRPNPVTSFVEDSESQSHQYTVDFIAEGNFNLSEKITLKAILGTSSFTSQFRQSAYRANNLSIAGFYDLSNTTGQLVGGLAGSAFVNQSERKTYGVFGDFAFGYDNFLTLSLTGRNDWTSTLDSNNNRYFYPSAGLSFVFSELIDFEPLDYGKFTVSNATVYNDLGAYQINETYGRQVGFPYSSTGLNGFVVPGTAVSPEVRKEKIATTEFGLNLEFFKRRVTLDAAYYMTKTTDLITTATLAPSTGANSLLTNIGSIKGTGLELSLGLGIIESDGFNWDLNTNFTMNNQIVEEIQPGVTELNLTTGTVASIYAVVDEDFPQVKATSYVRDPQGRVVINPANGNPIVGGLENLGKTTPDYIVGLTNVFSYKGLKLTATLDYRTGHVFYSQLADRMEFTGRSQASVSSNRQDFIFPNSVINTGTVENPVYVANTNIQVTGGRQNFWTNTYNDIKENYIIDGTALKIRELSLSYQLADKAMDKIGVSKLSIGLVARNILTWLPEENRFSDPEFDNSIGVGNAIGIGGYTQAPPTRSFGLNLNIEF